MTEGTTLAPVIRRAGEGEKRWFFGGGPSDGADRRDSDPYRSVRFVRPGPVPFCHAAPFRNFRNRVRVAH
jgi:hypothetical protein